MEGWMPGMEGMPGMGQPEVPPAISNLRVVLVTDKGQIDSGKLDLELYQEEVENWYRIVVPLSQFSGPGKDPEARLQKVALFGDIEDHFWIGRMRIVSEEQPLQADAGRNRKVRVDQEVRFTAAEQEFGVRARYAWDFDSWDGITEDQVGREVTWTFDEAGYYTVTLTVTDPAGQKTPQTDTILVLVE